MINPHTTCWRGPNNKRAYKNKYLTIPFHILLFSTGIDILREVYGDESVVDSSCGEAPRRERRRRLPISFVMKTNTFVAAIIQYYVGPKEAVLEHFRLS